MISPEKRKKLINYLKDMNEIRENEFWKLFTDFLFKNTHLSPKEKENIKEKIKTEFYKTLDKMYYTEYELLHIKTYATQEELEKIQAFRAQAVKKKRGPKPKKWTELELKYKHLIKQLRDKGLSWREISEYLKRYHKKKYSPAYLMRFYKQTFEE